MSELVIVFVVALLVESVWQALKPLWPRFLHNLQDRGAPVDGVGALIVSLILCFAYQVDLLALIGLKITVWWLAPWLGIVLTAILMYRGSIPLHDVIESIGALRQIKKSDAQATNNKIDAGM